MTVANEEYDKLENELDRLKSEMEDYMQLAA